MENEIKVGDFIRTAQGTIAQIEEDEFEIKTNVRGQILYEKWVEGNRYYEVIVKHSSNLIDLIQCGDYVNGEKVEKITEPSLANDYNRLIYCNECEELYKVILFNKDIKTIVTKEMMKSIEYRVNRDMETN